jgi:hypothetical protein
MSIDKEEKMEYTLEKYSDLKLVISNMALSSQEISC